MKQITTLGLESKVDLHTAEKLTHTEYRSVPLQNVYILQPATKSWVIVSHPSWKWYLFGRGIAHRSERIPIPEFKKKKKHMNYHENLGW